MAHRLTAFAQTTSIFDDDDDDESHPFLCARRRFPSLPPPPPLRPSTTSNQRTIKTVYALPERLGPPGWLLDDRGNLMLRNAHRIQLYYNHDVDVVTNVVVYVSLVMLLAGAVRMSEVCWRAVVTSKHVSAHPHAHSHASYTGCRPTRSRVCMQPGGADIGAAAVCTSSRRRCVSTSSVSAVIRLHHLRRTPTYVGCAVCAARAR